MNRAERGCERGRRCLLILNVVRKLGNIKCLSSPWAYTDAERIHPSIIQAASPCRVMGVRGGVRGWLHVMETNNQSRFHSDLTDSPLHLMSMFLDCGETYSAETNIDTKRTCKVHTERLQLFTNRNKKDILEVLQRAQITLHFIIFIPEDKTHSCPFFAPAVVLFQDLFCSFVHFFFAAGLCLSLGLCGRPFWPGRRRKMHNWQRNLDIFRERNSKQLRRRSTSVNF